MTEQEELEYLRLKKRKAVAMQATAPARPEVNERDIPYADMAPKKPINIDAALDGGARNAVDIVKDRFVRQREVGDDFERQALDARAQQAGKVAGDAALEGQNLNNPAAFYMAGPASFVPRRDAEQKVMNDAGVMTPDQAGYVRTANSIGLGAPAAFNETFRGAVKQAGEDQPGASLAGDIGGSILPSQLAFSGTKAAYNATLKPLITRVLPQGGSKLAQATRFGVHAGEQVGTWAGQNALWRGTTGASIDAAMEGRAPTFEDVKEGAIAGATDPINAAGGLGGIGLSRTLRFLKTGGRTSVPTDRADFASSLAGRAPGSGTVLDAERFGDIDPLAEKQLLRLLNKFPPKDVRAALNSFEDASQGIVDEALLPTRLKDIFVEKLGDGAAGPIDDFLKGAGNSTGAPSARIVAEGVAEDRAALSQFVNDSANKRFGSGGRYETFKAAEQDLKEIGTQYENLFKPGAVVASPQDEQALREVVAFYAGDKEMMKYVSAQARKLKMTPEQFIESNPRRAAHMMQQVAREIADETTSRTMANAYGGIRDNLLQPLEAATPGYRQAREAFGDEYGFQQALGFANRFFTKAEDDIAVGLLAEEFAAMNPRQQEAAKIGMRDEALKFANRRTEGGSARLTKIGNEPSLAAMERVFGQDGAEFANDLRATLARSDRNTYISSAGPNTTNKAEAIKKAQEAVSNPLTRQIGNALQAIGVDSAASAVTGMPTPIMSIRAGIAGMGNALAKGRQGKIDNLTDLLMRNAGSRPRAPMSGDGPVPTPTAAPVNALSQGADPVAAPARSFTRNDSGMVTPDAASALSVAGGAGTGASVAGDVDGDGKLTWKDRAAGAAAGAAVGYGLKKGIGGASDALFTNQVMAREGGRASRMASEAIANIPKPSRPGQPMTGAEADDLLTARLNEVLAKNRIDPRDFYAGTAKIDQKKFAPMQEAERLVLEDMKALGYGPPADAEWLRAIRTFSPEQYNKWQATGARDMVSKFRQVQGKEMTPEIPPFEGPRVIDSPGRSMVKPRPSNDTKSSGVAALRGDATNALAGGAVGGMVPDEDGNFSPTNALIGATGAVAGARAFPGVRGARGAGPRGAKRPLPMGEPARMARAKADGFDTDTVLYHGTGRDFKAFDPKAAASSPDTAGGDIYLTNNRSVANEYAFESGGKPAVLPVFTRMKNPMRVDQGGGQTRDSQIRGWVANAKANGHDGLVIENARDGVTRNAPVSNITVIFDPKNIRSKFAKFDPDQSDSPILSAGISGKPRLGKSLHDIMSDNPPPRDPKTGQFVKQEPKKPKSPILPLTAAGAATLGGVGYYATHSGKPRKDPADDRKLMNRALATQRK